MLPRWFGASTVAIFGSSPGGGCSLTQCANAGARDPFLPSSARPGGGWPCWSESLAPKGGFLSKTPNES
jgi:hypothetical protein